jgi:hypothetical protein
MSGTIKDAGSQAFVSRIGTDREALGQKIQPEKAGPQFSFALSQSGPSASARTAANQKIYRGMHFFDNRRALIFAALALPICTQKVKATYVSSDFDEASQSGASESPRLARDAGVGQPWAETATATHFMVLYPVHNSEHSKWCGYWNPGSYIDSGRYYCLDSWRYIYFDISRYNLLGLNGYAFEQSCHPVWHEYGSYYLGSAITFSKIGSAFGQAMLELIEDAFATHN